MSSQKKGRCLQAIDNGVYDADFVWVRDTKFSLDMLFEFTIARSSAACQMEN